MRYFLFAASFLSMTALGCGNKSDGGVEVFPVSGKVLVQGQPADGARVVLYPVSPDLTGPGMPVPGATTDETGMFHLQSFKPDDGAPEGEFKVTVIWPEPIPPNVDQEMYRPKDRLRGKYANADTTTLTATVPEGGGELPPFDLK